MLHGTAATVMLLRDDPNGLQVLLLERPHNRGSFAGAWVFPGGVVDPEDYAEPGENDDDELVAARRAGVRETAEETGLHLQSRQLARLSCWVPPPETPRRYKTWFFLAPAPAGEIRLSPQEHLDAAWLTPAEAFHRHRRGSMALFPPTWVTLHGLLRTETVAAALAAAAGAVPETFTTRRLPGHVPAAMMWHGDAEYPDPPERGKAGADSSRRHRLIMDPNGWTYERTN